MWNCLSIIRSTIKNWLEQQHVRIRQSLMFIDDPSTAKIVELLQLSRKKIRMALGLLTNHCLNEHLHSIGVVKDPTWRGCYEDKKDPQHVLGE